MTGESSTTFGKLTLYRIEQLFGNRTITLAPLASGPTLLTGANGTGKSTILRTINAVGTGQWLDLFPVPFRSIELEFESGVSIRILKDAERPQTVLYIESGSRSWTLDRRVVELPDLDETDEARRVPTGWEIDGRTYQTSEARQILAIRNLAAETEGDWVSQIPRNFPVLYIPDQRLVPPGTQVQRRQVQSPFRNAPSGVVTAEQYARDLYRLIQEGLSQYAASSQTLDRDFPSRVVSAMSEPADVGRGFLDDLLQKIETERTDLEHAGLLEKEDDAVTFDRDRLEDPKVAPVIQVYAEDTLAKFAVLAELKTRLKTFAGFLNAHYRDKRVLINPRIGFVIVLLEKGADGEAGLGELLSPSQLSSGEQQMLVLAYQILFRTEPGTLILIDEPELSLHVLWLSSLIDDFATMGAIRDLSFILATHSPTLVGDREELRVSLDPGGKRPGAVEMVSP